MKEKAREFALDLALSFLVFVMVFIVMLLAGGNVEEFLYVGF